MSDGPSANDFSNHERFELYLEKDSGCLLLGFHSFHTPHHERSNFFAIKKEPEVCVGYVETDLTEEEIVEAFRCALKKFPRSKEGAREIAKSIPTKAA